MNNQLLTKSVCAMAGIMPFSHTLAQEALLREKAEKPNIIFILADDIGYEAFGCNGGTSYNTPNIDRMAEKGMRYTQCYSQPLSAPSRQQLMTGKYNFRNYEGFGIMSPSECTFGDLMKDAGYTTGITGKWQQYGNAMQIQLAGHVGCLPNQVGFDDYFVWHTTFPYLANLPKMDKHVLELDKLPNEAKEQSESRYKDPVILSDKGKFTYHGQYGPDLFLTHAMEFIHNNKNKPFFLYYPMVLMHDPFQATPDSKDWDTSGAQDKSDPKYFGDMMSYMDKMIGKLINYVESEGIAENTLIIFTGDNGTNRKITSRWNNQNIRGNKGFPQEWGIHVPFIAYWKGHIQAGTVNENLIDFTDILPTFIEAANSKLPKDFVCDGHSILGQFLGKNDAYTRDYAFGWYDAMWLPQFKKAIWLQDKTHTWKYYQDGRFYNLKDDPDEQKPLDKKSLTKEGRLMLAKMNAEIERILNSYQINITNK